MSVSGTDRLLGKGRIGKSEWKGEVLTERPIHFHTQALAIGRVLGKWHLRECDNSVKCCYESDFM